MVPLSRPRRLRLVGLRLILHEDAAQAQPSAAGVTWLGFVVYRDHRLLKRRNVVNFRRRFRCNLDLYAAGRLSFAELDASMQSWINHVRYADSWGLRRALLASPIPKGNNLRIPRNNHHR